jgi:Asp-tRNA(Asn)/Glu-tRNA(Gln) amidotransferase C subunit
MDDLIKSIKIFSVTDNEEEFERSLDSVINKFQNLETEQKCEWSLLKSNYSKLRYLNHTLEKSNLNLKTNKKFLFSLNRFMDYIDKITQMYLQNVNWENQDEYSELE